MRYITTQLDDNKGKLNYYIIDNGDIVYTVDDGKETFLLEDEKLIKVYRAIANLKEADQMDKQNSVSQTSDEPEELVNDETTTGWRNIVINGTEYRINPDTSCLYVKDETTGKWIVADNRNLFRNGTQPAQDIEPEETEEAEPVQDDTPEPQLTYYCTKYDVSKNNSDPGDLYVDQDGNIYIGSVNGHLEGTPTLSDVNILQASKIDIEQSSQTFRQIFELLFGKILEGKIEELHINTDLLESFSPTVHTKFGNIEYEQLFDSDNKRYIAYMSNGEKSFICDYESVRYYLTGNANRESTDEPNIMDTIIRFRANGQETIPMEWKSVQIDDTYYKVDPTNNVLYKLTRDDNGTMKWELDQEATNRYRDNPNILGFKLAEPAVEDSHPINPNDCITLPSECQPKTLREGRLINRIKRIAENAPKDSKIAQVAEHLYIRMVAKKVNKQIKIAKKLRREGKEDEVTTYYAIMRTDSYKGSIYEDMDPKMLDDLFLKHTIDIIADNPEDYRVKNLERANPFAQFRTKVRDMWQGRATEDRENDTYINPLEEEHATDTIEGPGIDD